MALTKTGTDGIKNDAITSGKIPANAVGTSEIADTSVTLAKLEHGTSSNDGKFLRANNGADPTFESLPASGLTNIVEDTSPQLGGDLQSNGSHIAFADNDKALFGNGNDVHIYHNGTHSYIESNTGTLYIRDGGNEKVRINGYGTAITGGLLFGTDTAAANALDDYEYGTFTPTCAVEGQSNFSLSVAKGLYVKVGKTVHVWFEIQADETPSNRTTGNAWEFGGFPFLSQNDTDSSHAGLRDYRYPLIAIDIDSSASYGTNGHFLLRLNDNSSGGRIEWQDSSLNIRNASLYIQNGTHVQFGCTYPTGM